MIERKKSINWWLRAVWASSLVLCGGMVSAQTVLTMDKAMEIAQINSPEVRRTLMSLQNYQQQLIAQRASLKSQFSLDLNPLTYANGRSFDSRLSQWYTNQQLSMGGTFRIQQPILWTDGVISLNNQFSWQKNSSNLGDGNTNSNEAFTNNLYLSFTQPLFTYNTRKMALQRIEYNLENAQIQYALQRLSTEREIMTSFYNVYTIQQQLTISRDELVNAQQNFDIIKSKVEGDLAARSELFQAELNLASARSAVDNNQVSLENAKDALKQALGMSLNEDISVTADVENIDTVKVDMSMAIEHGLNARLELRQREIDTKMQEFNLIQAKDADKFKGSLSLSIGLAGDNPEFTKIYEQTTSSPRVALTFSVPIFDWGARKARIKAQEITMEAQEITNEQQKITIEMNIRQTCRQIVNLKQKIEIDKQSVNNAQLTYDLNLIRYRQGELSGLQISQFQSQLSSAKSSYTSDCINYKIQLLNLKILSLYDFESGQEIVPLKDFNPENK